MQWDRWPTLVVVVQGELPGKRETMMMLRQGVGKIASARSHGQECLHLVVVAVEVVRLRHPGARARRMHFEAGEHRQQASSKVGELAGLGALQGPDTIVEAIPNRVLRKVVPRNLAIPNRVLLKATPRGIVDSAKVAVFNACQIIRACETKDIKCKPIIVFGMSQSVPPVEVAAFES